MRDYIGYIVALLCIVALLFVVNERERTQNVNTLRPEIIYRDSLIKESHDTVIYRIKTTKEIITDYRTITDTVEKLVACDSLANECERLANACKTNDSLCQLQIFAYNVVIEAQDKKIDSLKSDNLRLKKRLKAHRIITAAAIGTTLGSIFLR